MTVTTTDLVRPVTAYEQQQAISALVLAFDGDPMMRWVFPDPHHYLQHFPQLVGALGSRAFDAGTAYCAGDFAATALWLPPGVEPDEQALVAVLQRDVAERRREAVFAIIEQLDTYHPAEPHWYLPVIGVDPTRQGRGYGSALLDRALKQCDAAHQAAYLESSNQRSVPLYERHGFEVLGTVQAADSPPLWPMLRRAR
jgi:ribosomal protein S18 acetylase RimI-like enzyme